jgi:hypothetical protein
MADDKKNPFTPAATPVKLPAVDTAAGPAAVAPMFSKEQEAYIQQLVAMTAMNAAMTVMQNMKKEPATNPAYNRNAAPVVHEVCSVCNQVKPACKGEHMLTVVYPQKYPEWAGFFPGVKINGVTYRSGNENHRIYIPTVAASTILNTVLAFEEAEKNIHIKRKARHDSGSIGGSGTGAKQANVSWS